jgi:hypothetical protein
VRVTPRMQDAIMGAWHSMRLRPIALAVFALCFVALPWAALLAEIALGVATPGAILELGLAPMLAIVVFGFGIPLLAYRWSKRSPAAGDVVHRITDDGIATIGNGWDRTVRWSAVTGCHVWRGAVLLRSGRQPVLYLPARCITSELAVWLLVRVEREGSRPGGTVERSS